MNEEIKVALDTLNERKLVVSMAKNREEIARNAYQVALDAYAREKFSFLIGSEVVLDGSSYLGKTVRITDVSAHHKDTDQAYLVVSGRLVLKSGKSGKDEIFLGWRKWLHEEWAVTYHGLHSGLDLTGKQSKKTKEFLSKHQGATK